LIGDGVLSRRQARLLGVEEEHIVRRLVRPSRDADAQHDRFALACALNTLVEGALAWDVAETWGAADGIWAHGEPGGATLSGGVGSCGVPW
jgi:hypothetical protein